MAMPPLSELNIPFQREDRHLKVARMKQSSLSIPRRFSHLPEKWHYHLISWVRFRAPRLS